MIEKIVKKEIQMMEKIMQNKFYFNQKIFNENYFFSIISTRHTTTIFTGSASGKPNLFRP